MPPKGREAHREGQLGILFFCYLFVLAWLDLVAVYAGYEHSVLGVSATVTFVSIGNVVRALS
jgi:hypothetical protein